MPADPLPHDAARVALAALLTDTRAAQGYAYLTASTAPVASALKQEPMHG